MNQFLQCPKCHGAMRTYNRGGVNIEQCDGCHGIFLDHGELDALTRFESQWTQPQPGTPAWGAPQHGDGHGYGHGDGHGHGRGDRRGFSRMLFSS